MMSVQRPPRASVKTLWPTRGSSGLPRNDRATGYRACCVDDLHGSQIARASSQSDQVAKDWLVRMIQRTPLADVSELPLNVFSEQGPKLIDSILAELPNVTATPDADLSPE